MHLLELAGYAARGVNSAAALSALMLCLKRVSQLMYKIDETPGISNGTTLFSADGILGTQAIYAGTISTE